MLKQILCKVREWLHKARKWMPPEDSPFYRVRYTSVPLVEAVAGLLALDLQLLPSRISAHNARRLSG
jgi:hypothetical protein